MSPRNSGAAYRCPVQALASLILIIASALRARGLRAGTRSGFIALDANNLVAHSEIINFVPDLEHCRCPRVVIDVVIR